MSIQEYFVKLVSMPMGVTRVVVPFCAIRQKVLTLNAVLLVWSSCIVQFTVYSVHCTLYTVFCTMYNIHCKTVPLSDTSIGLADIQMEARNDRHYEIRTDF